jgi:tRNA threonylcarbamoyl adenosine modification protein (Sua5/YciO/YrdC/YwlC family)
MLLEIDPVTVKPRLIAQAVAILAAGGVIAYPTDTTYGLGCSILSRKGIERIYRIKQRERKKPFSFICSDLAEVSRYARLSNFAFKTLRRYLPGPYTFVLEASRIVPELVMTKQKTVGIRIPDNSVCLALVASLGQPIVTTSANRSGEDPIGDPLQVHEELGSELDLVIDGGLLSPNVSSVINLVGDYPEVLRQGVGDTSWCSRY